MPKRKKLPPVPDYIDGGKCGENSVIQKSNPLLTLSETELTLPEFKILDAYLGRINSHDPEKRTVKFEKGELERLLGVTRILKTDLDKRLRHLFQVVEVKDDTKKKGFKLVSLFEEADADVDENGLWQVVLTCTTSAREYIFNVDNIGYLQYRLKNVIDLTSRYSYVLYLYLENNRFRKSWSIALDELKKLLNCTAETYTQFKRFNDLILKKAQKELEEKTECKFTYEPVKKGRKVVAVKFTLKTIKETISIEDENQLSFDDLDVSNESPYDIYHAIMGQIGVSLTDEQYAVLIDLSKPHVEYDPFGPLPYEIKIAEYIKLKCRLMKAQTKPVKNEFAWLKKACEEDW